MENGQKIKNRDLGGNFVQSSFGYYYMTTTPGYHRKATNLDRTLLPFMIKTQGFCYIVKVSLKVLFVMVVSEHV